MVYKKYIKRDGKVFGPYYYESYRDENGNVKTRYLENYGSKSSKKIAILGLFLGLFVLLLLGIYATNVYAEDISFFEDIVHVTGKVVGQVVGQTGDLAEDVVEKVSLNIKSNIKNFNSFILGFVAKDKETGKEEVKEEKKEEKSEEKEDKKEKEEKEKEKSEGIGGGGKSKEKTKKKQEQVSNETEIINETEVIDEIISDVNVSINTTQYNAIINKPVRWKKDIKLEKPEIVKIKLPKQAENITVYKIVSEETDESEEGGEVSNETSEESQESEKQLKEEEEETSKLDANPRSDLHKEKLPKEKVKITGKIISKTSSSSHPIIDFFKKLFSTITGRIIIIEYSEGIREVTIEENGTEFAIVYETPAPTSIEEKTAGGKKITIVGPDTIHYENVLAYTMLAKEAKESMIKLYYLINNSKVLTNFSAYDLNNNSLVDYIEWIVPHLSNQSYELEIIILNVQSYPTVGGNWTVRFNTTGTANLTITPVNGTNWTHLEYDNESQLLFLELKCESTILNYTWLDETDSVFYPNYSCNKTGYEISQVLIAGKHTLEFDFGGFKAYAYNSPGFSGDGSGTAGDPYQITNCTQVQEMKDNTTAYYILMNNIDCSDTVNWNSEAGFLPVGNSSVKFTGNFDGKNHTITDLYINRSSIDYIGLFGYVDTVNISNVGLVDVNITGNGRVGSLAGSITGTVFVSNSYANGTLNSDGGSSGGLVGQTESGLLSINNSYFVGSIYSSGYYIGGLVGYGTVNVSNSYSAGLLNTTLNDLGGLVGVFSSGGNIINSFTTSSMISDDTYAGSVVGEYHGTFTNTYWNNHSNNPDECTANAGNPSGCNMIQDNESYFYYSSNAPMSSWDFTNVWQENANDYPTLKGVAADNSPSVTLDSPADNYVNNTSEYVNITFNASVSDDFGLVNCSLWHNGTGTWHLNQSQNLTGTGNVSEFNLTDLSSVSFIWNIECYDNANQVDWGNANRTMILNWTLPPVCDVNLSSCKTSGWSENTVYCLNQSVNITTHCMQITANNVTLNCQGYNMTGDRTGPPNDYGVYVEGYNYTTIRNCEVYNFHYGVYLSYANYSTILNNIADNNSYYGFYIQYSSYNNLTANIARNHNNQGFDIRYSCFHNIFTNNTANNNRLGFYHYTSQNSTLTNNILYNNTYNFNVWGNSYSYLDNNIDTTNTVDGKPIYYIKNTTNTEYDSSTNAGVFYCIQCNNVTIKDLNLTKNRYGIFFWNTTNSSITNINSSYNDQGILLDDFSSYNNITSNIIANNDEGIFLDDNSSYNNIINNTVYNNYDGISLTSTSYNNIINNTVYNNYEGIYLDTCSYNNIINNTVYNNDNGIYLDTCSYNNITNNTANNNEDYGIYIRGSSSSSSLNNLINFNTANNNSQYGIYIYYYISNNTITSNIINNNSQYGVYIRSSSNNNTITNNTITNNLEHGIYIDSSNDNSIYNNFFSNSNNAYDNSYNDWNTTKTGGTNIIGGNWLGGNYWSDYTGADTSEDGIGDTEIPYNSSGNITNGGDYLPLVYECDYYLDDCKNSSWEYGKKYCLNQGVDTNEDCMIINNDSITLNCKGFNITGDGGDYGIDNNNYNNIIIKNCNINTFAFGIYWHNGADYGLILNNTISNNDNHGILIHSSSNNNLTNNTLINNDNNGIYIFSSSNNNTLTHNTANNNSEYGIQITSSSNNILTSNTANNNSLNGIYIFSSSNNIIYNNYFNNIQNAYDTYNNYWNTTYNCSGPKNIIGGDCTGGNYWSDYTGADTDEDGIGDTLIPYNNNITNGGDYLPLLYPECEEYLDDCKTSGWEEGKVYCLNQSVSTNEDCMIINNDSITLNCKGFNMTGDGGAGDYGIDNNDYDNVTIKNCKIYNFLIGIYWRNGADSGLILNNIANNNSEYGLYLYNNSNYNNLTSNTANDNSYDGIYLYQSSNNTLTNNIANNNTYNGIYIRSSSSNNLTSNIVDNNNQRGILLFSGANNNTITNNTITNSLEHGIYIVNSNDNSIYNNFFSNSNNAYDNSYNDWNTTYNCSGPKNIVGENCTGGNSWSDYAGVDDGSGSYPNNISNDGIGDTLIPYNNNITNGGDYLPLVYNTGPIFSNPSNTSIDFKIDNNFTANITINDVTGLSGYIFSTNASGTWENKTASISGAEYNASESAKIELNHGNQICWYYWANDTTELVSQSNTYCFNVINTPPTHDTPILTSTLGTDYTTEDLTVYPQNVQDSDNDSVKNITNWYKDDNSIIVLNMPFEGGSNSTWTRDYSEYKNNGTVTGATWNATSGYDGFGGYDFDGDGDSINVSDSSSLDLTNEITLETWIKGNSSAVEFNSTYDFTDTTNNDAYYISLPDGGTDVPREPGHVDYSEYGGPEYSDVSASDSNWNEWVAPGVGSGWYVNLLYKFKINEDESDINRLKITWIGYDNLKDNFGDPSGGDFELNTWAGTWSNWFRTWTSYESDQTYTKTYTSGIDNIIDGSNNLYIGVSGGFESCFLGGTRILMADGSYKNIEDIKIGDKVKSYDEENKVMANSKIAKTFYHEKTDYYLVINEKLRLTSNHPMYVNGKWKEAGEIKIGDLLLDKNGNHVPVTTIEKVVESVPVYNLEVMPKNYKFESYCGPSHNYFAEDILVHNKCPRIFSYNGTGYEFDSLINVYQVGEKKDRLFNYSLKYLKEPKIKVEYDPNEINYVNFIKLVVEDKAKDKEDKISFLNPVSISCKEEIDCDLQILKEMDKQYFILDENHTEIFLGFEKLPELEPGYSRAIKILSSGYQIIIKPFTFEDYPDYVQEWLIEYDQEKEKQLKILSEEQEHNTLYENYVKVNVYWGGKAKIIYKGTDAYALMMDTSGNIIGYINNQNVSGSKASGWNHVVMTYDGFVQKLYINGELADSQSITGSINTNSNKVIIGEEFDGIIDEVRIYNRSLSYEQINALYENRTDLIVSQETSVGDVWQACITPNDRTIDGATNCSNNLTIIEESAPPGRGGGCNDKCLSGSGEKECINSTTLKTRDCGDYESDRCLEWSDWEYTTCNDNEICENGGCIIVYTDECTLNEKECVSETSYRICGDYDPDDCTEWSDSINCEQEEICEEGVCIESVCEEDWDCTWSACINGLYTPNCVDLNDCGTAKEKPEKIPCDEDEIKKKDCRPDIICNAWTGCDVSYTFEDLLRGVEKIEGKQFRVCEDREKCVEPRYETKICSIKLDIYAKRGWWCKEVYIEIYNKFTRELLSRIKDRKTMKNPSLDISLLTGKAVQQYCDYCFNGVQDGDEEWIDCGGSCRKCVYEGYELIWFEKLMWKLGY